MAWELLGRDYMMHTVTLAVATLFCCFVRSAGESIDLHLSLPDPHGSSSRSRVDVDVNRQRNFRWTGVNPINRTWPRTDSDAPKSLETHS